MQHEAAIGRPFDPAEELECQAGVAEGAEACPGLGVAEDLGVSLGRFGEYRHHLVDVGAVGDGNASPDAVAVGRSARLVDDLGGSHHAIGDGDLDVVAGEQPGGAQADLGDLAAFPTVEDDEVADLVGPVGQDGHSGEQVGQRVLGGEGEGETDDPGRRHQAGHVDVPDEQDRVEAGDEDHHRAGVGEQRLGGLLHHAEAVLVLAHRGQKQPQEAQAEGEPDDDEDRLHHQDRVALRRGAELEPVGSQDQSAQSHRGEDGTVQQRHQLVVEVGLGTSHEALQRAGENSVDDPRQDGGDDDDRQRLCVGVPVEEVDNLVPEVRHQSPSRCFACIADRI